MRAALERTCRCSAICRGMQLMAASTGGTLHQHLPDVIGRERHRAAPAPRSGTDPLAADASAYGRHDVVVRPARGRTICSARTSRVNSFHHQAVDDPGAFTAVGWCPDDRVIEIIEDPKRTRSRSASSGTPSAPPTCGCSPPWPGRRRSGGPDNGRAGRLTAADRGLVASACAGLLRL